MRLESLHYKMLQKHEGQTRDKTILAKIMGNVPELRQKAKGNITNNY